jgi:hypothetical protein
MLCRADRARYSRVEISGGDDHELEKDDVREVCEGGVLWRELGPGEWSRADLEEAVDLLASSFGRWPGTPKGIGPVEHLEWKLSAPDVESRLYLGSVEGRLATMHASLGRRVRVRERDFPSHLWVDGAVRPALQRRGLTRARTAFAEGGAHERIPHYRFSRAEHPAMKKMLSVLGFRALGPALRAWARPLGAGDGAGAGRIASVLAAPVMAAVAASSSRRARECPTEVAHDVGAEFDGLFEAAAGEFSVIGVRDHRYLRWRYVDARAGRFRVRVARDQGQLLGYVVTTVVDGAGSVVDLLSRPGADTARLALLGAAMEDLRSDGCHLAVAWLSGVHPYAGSLRRAGFVDSRRSLGLTWLASGSPPPPIEAFSDPCVTQLTPGDTDEV